MDDSELWAMSLRTFWHVKLSNIRSNSDSRPGCSNNGEYYWDAI